MTTKNSTAEPEHTHLPSTGITCPRLPPLHTTPASTPRARPHQQQPDAPTRTLRRPETLHHDGCLKTRCAADPSRPKRRTRGCDRWRQDRRVTSVGFRPVPVGGSSWYVFAVGRGGWRSSQESGAGGVSLAVKTQRGAGP
jgi:hypothetical protein